MTLGPVVADDRLASLPKVELHLHLEGSLRPATVLALAKKNDVDIGCSTEEELAARYRFRDFLHFIELFQAGLAVIQTPEDYVTVADALTDELAAQNVRHAEITTTPLHALRWRGFSEADYAGALDEAQRRAAAKGVSVGWIPTSPGATSCPSDGLTVGLLDGPHCPAGTVAMGIGGPEAEWPPELYVDDFARARAAGVPRGRPRRRGGRTRERAQRARPPARRAHRPRRPGHGGPDPHRPPGRRAGADRGLPHLERPPHPARRAEHRGPPDRRHGRGRAQRVGEHRRPRLLLDRPHPRAPPGRASTTASTSPPSPPPSDERSTRRSPPPTLKVRVHAELDEWQTPERRGQARFTAYAGPVAERCATDTRRAHGRRAQPHHRPRPGQAGVGRLPRRHPRPGGRPTGGPVPAGA